MALSGPRRPRAAANESDAAIVIATTFRRFVFPRFFVAQGRKRHPSPLLRIANRPWHRSCEGLDGPNTKGATVMAYVVCEPCRDCQVHRLRRRLSDGVLLSR